MSGPAPDAKAPQPAPQPATPAPAATPSSASTRARRNVAGAIDGDSAKTIRLLIRRHVAESAAALAAPPELRPAKTAVAANQLNAAIDEIRELAKQQAVDWNKLEPDLESLFGEAHELVQSVVADSSIASEGFELQKAIVGLEQDVGQRIADRATAKQGAAPKPRMTEADSMALARLEIAAARKQVAAFREAVPTLDRDRAIVLVEPLHKHLRQAVAASLDVANRMTRDQLTADVEALSAELNGVAQTLATHPKLPWASAFATAFDTENQMRTAIGLSTIARPYTGTIDPAQAAEAVAKLAKDPSAATTTQFADPQAAVNHIVWLLDRVYEAKEKAIERFGTAMKEKGADAEPWWQKLLEFAVTTALSAISAGVATAISKSIESALKATASDGALRSINPVNPKLTKYEVDKAFEDALKPTAVMRAVIVDAAKDATKNISKATLEAGLTTLKTEPHSTEPLGQFVELHVNAFSAERTTANAEIVSLESALAQLELGELTALAGQLNDAPTIADQLVFEHATYEWENLRARAATGASDHEDPNLNGARRATGEEAIAGVLEVGLDVDADRSKLSESKLAYMVLRDGEPAAVKSLRHLKRRLGSIAMNRAYQFSFDRFLSDTAYPGSIVPTAGASFVKVGVGAKQGFQASTVDAIEMKLLTRYASSRSVGTNATAALELAGERVADELESAPNSPAAITSKLADQQRTVAAEADAYATVRALIELADSFTSDRLGDE